MRFLLAFLLTSALAAPQGSVVDTRHNLSASGPGPIRAVDEDEVCVFCHAAHPPESGPTLWNHETPATVAYRPYERDSLKSRPGQPDGASVLCLSCHDGTIALGAVHSRPAPIAVIGAGASGRLGADRKSDLGTDLSGTHPISVAYREALAGPDARSSVRVRNLTPEQEKTWLDREGKVQCTSCHDPHVDPAAMGIDVPAFWRGASIAETCETCHLAPLVDAPHADDRLLGRGCGSCHVGHGVGGEALLPSAEEESCYTCHGDDSDQRAAQESEVLTPVAEPTAIEPLFSAPYHHPVEESRGEHQYDEDLGAVGAAAPRHVECVDCHATHGEEAPVRSGAARGRGAPVTGVLGAAAEHEVCYGCHGPVANLPYGETDKAAELDPNNKSFHPIEAPSPAATAPSLLPPWRKGQRMTCSDCHGPDDRDAPAGPHGSNQPWILRAAYTATDGEPESRRAYALCYECHSRSVILGDQSFAGHAQHVVTGRVSCYACHDSHGSADEPGLVRFGKDIRYTSVAPARSGRLDYDPNSGRCWVSCHDTNHEGAGYAP